MFKFKEFGVLGIFLDYHMQKTRAHYLLSAIILMIEATETEKWPSRKMQTVKKLQIEQT